MIVRIEFSKGRSAYYQNAVNIAAAAPGYRVHSENGVHTHSVVLDPVIQRDLLLKIWQLVCDWRTTVFYIDDRVVGFSEMAKVVWPDAPAGGILLADGTIIDSGKVVEAVWERS